MTGRYPKIQQEKFPKAGTGKGHAGVKFYIRRGKAGPAGSTSSGGCRAELSAQGGLAPSGPGCSLPSRPARPHPSRPQPLSGCQGHGRGSPRLPAALSWGCSPRRGDKSIPIRSHPVPCGMGTAGSPAESSTAHADAAGFVSSL